MSWVDPKPRGGLFFFSWGKLCFVFVLLWENFWFGLKNIHFMGWQSHISDASQHLMDGHTTGKKCPNSEPINRSRRQWLFWPEQTRAENAALTGLLTFRTSAGVAEPALPALTGPSPPLSDVALRLVIPDFRGSCSKRPVADLGESCSRITKTVSLWSWAVR